MDTSGALLDGRFRYFICFTKADFPFTNLSAVGRNKARWVLVGNPDVFVVLERNV